MQHHQYCTKATKFSKPDINWGISCTHEKFIMFINLSNIVESVDAGFVSKSTQKAHFSRNTTTTKIKQVRQDKPHGWNSSMELTVIFTAGCIANIIILIYFMTRYGRKQTRKIIPTVTFYDHTKIRITIRRRKMSSYHFLLILLAIADLICCAILLVASYQYLWHSNDWYCPLGSLIMESCSMFSICSLVLLFYERYRGIVYQRQEPLKKRTYLLASFVCFLFSWGAFIPEIFEVELHDGRSCVLKKSYTKDEFFAVFSWYRFIDAVLPTVLMFWFRLKISKHIHNVTNNLSVSGGTIRRRTASDINRRAALRTINWLFGFYTLLIVPWRIVYTVSEYFLYFHEDFVQKYDRVFEIGKAIVLLLFFLNNVVNIFVYLVLIPDFRRFLKKTFSCGILSK